MTNFDVSLENVAIAPCWWQLVRSSQFHPTATSLATRRRLGLAISLRKSATTISEQIRSLQRFQRLLERRLSPLLRRERLRIWIRRNQLGWANLHLALCR